MKQLIRLIGLSVSCMAAGIYLQGMVRGICIGLFVMGLGLFADSLKK